MVGLRQQGFRDDLLHLEKWAPIEDSLKWVALSLVRKVL